MRTLTLKTFKWIERQKLIAFSTNCYIDSEKTCDSKRKGKPKNKSEKKLEQTNANKKKSNTTFAYLSYYLGPAENSRKKYNVTLLAFLS